MFRFLFPSFERPVERPRFVNLEPESHDFRGVGTVLLLAASCGVALALWEPSHQVTSPFVAAPGSRSAPMTADRAPSQETTAAAAAADADDDAAPTVKLSTLCSQKTTARRDCAEVKAIKDARLNAPEPTPEPAKQRKSPVVAAQSPSKANQAVASKPSLTPAVAPSQAPAVTPSQASAAPSATPPRPPADIPTQTASVTQPETSAAQSQKTAFAPKAKRQRQPTEEASVERLVRVQDQVTPDGRRVPVYRRVGGSGGYEVGTIVDGEYRASRRLADDHRPARRARVPDEVIAAVEEAAAEGRGRRPSPRYFGLQ